MWNYLFHRVFGEIFIKLVKYDGTKGLVIAKRKLQAFIKIYGKIPTMKNGNWPGKLSALTIKDVSTGLGTALLLKINELKLILDCYFNLDDENACNLSASQDLIFISHAHKDHYSELKALTSKYDSIPVLMSWTTLDLIQYFIRGKKNKRLREYLMSNAYPLIFNDTYFINNNISFQILKAGHFPGAAMLNIHMPNHNLLFTGDLSLYDLQPIMGANSGIQNVTGP
ncbi:MAG: MBL fold metallo-hydrolase, partial [Promethearchaeota archaeon]